MTTTYQPWHIRDRVFAWGSRTYVMGIVNVTPDSFSDGGECDSVERVLERVETLLPFADVLDIGGESTRPGAPAVSVNEELERVLPAIAAIRTAHPEIPISIDTTKSAVARAALAAGADLINDVSAGRFDIDMLPLAATQRVPVILMHMQGEPRTMQQQPTYKHVVREVKKFLNDAVGVAIAAGIPKHLIAVDVGIGFGKLPEHNLELLRHLHNFQSIGCPILAGVSRKSFIGKLCNQPEPRDRLMGTAAACTIAIAGGADMLRVHDAKEIKDVCRVADATYRHKDEQHKDGAT